MQFRNFIRQTQDACCLELHSLSQASPAIEIYPVADMDHFSSEELALRMRALPEQYLFILLLHFGCDISYSEIDEILDMQGAAGTAGFALQLLAYGFNMPASPSAGILQEAADNILFSFTERESIEPSKRCDRRIRAILNGKLPPAPAKRLPLRTLVAAAILAALLLALTAVATAALIRNTFHWSMTATDEGIVVTASEILREPTAEDYDEMRLYHPSRLPAGFAYAYTDDREANYLTAYYHNGEGQRIILWKALAGPSVVFGITNEELDSFEQLEVGDTIYLYYEHSRHGRGVIYWEMDGYAFMLVTPFDRAEALKIAQSVSKEK